MHSILCNSLTVSYGANTVLKDISFYVDRGECLSVIGENGTGKSTLLKCILGLLKPDGGTITTDDFSLTEVGYLPQQTGAHPDFPASVFEVVLSGCLNMRGTKPFYSKKEKALAITNLERVGAEGFMRKSFSSLSGGQQQRVLLARALCCAKKLLILDEPVAGLDPLASKELYGVIRQLKQDGLSVLMVSHDMAQAISVSDRILHLSADPSGYFFGTTADYIKGDYYRSFGEVYV